MSSAETGERESMMREERGEGKEKEKVGVTRSGKV